MTDAITLIVTTILTVCGNPHTIVSYDIETGERESIYLDNNDFIHAAYQMLDKKPELEVDIAQALSLRCV